MQFRVRIVYLEPPGSNATTLPEVSSLLSGASLVRVEGTETAAARATLVPPDEPGGGFALDVASPLAGASMLISLSPRTTQAEVERLASTLVRARATTLLIDVPAGTTARQVRAIRSALDTYLAARGRLLLGVSAEPVAARVGGGAGSLLGLALVGLGLVYLARQEG